MTELLLFCAVAAAAVAAVMSLAVLSTGVLVTAGLVVSLWIATRAHMLCQTLLGHRVEEIATPDIIGRQWSSSRSSLIATPA